MKPEIQVLHQQKRLQFSIRSLLIFVLVLGPLSGWYGPQIVVQIRALWVDETPVVSKMTPTLSQIQARQAMYKKALERQGKHRATTQASRDRIEAHRLVREAYRQSRLAAATTQGTSNRNPLVKRDGTFNMRYHLSPSER